MRNKPSLAEKGVFDLRGVSFAGDTAFALDGGWEFYPGRLLTPGDFAGPKAPGPPVYIEVPGRWNGLEFENKKIKGTGCATYRLIIHTDDMDRLTAFKVPSIHSAYKLYANGELIGEKGTTGYTKESTVPQSLPAIYLFNHSGPAIELILQVANFHHRSGGQLHPLWFGSEQKIRDMREMRLVFDLFLVGSLLIMSIYHLSLYFLRPRSYSPLYFGIFCLFVAFRSLIQGEIFFIHLFPDFSWELLLKIEYLTFYATLPVLAMFIYSLYPREYGKIMLRFIQAAGIIFSLLVLFTPAILFTYSREPFQIVALAAGVYTVSAFIRALINKREGSLSFLLGFIVLFLAVIHDMLYTNGFIFTQPLASLGFFSFVFSQAFVLSIRFSASFYTVEKLSVELEDLNKNLEQKVQERSEELFTRDTKLRESLLYARSIQQAILPGPDMLSDCFPGHFILWAPREVVGGDFYWLHRNSPDTYLIAVADCTGHGVPGAFMTMTANSVLNRIVGDFINNCPSKILMALNLLMKKSLQQGRDVSLSDVTITDNGLDMGLCYVDTRAGKLTFAGARISLFYSLDGKVKRIKGDKQSIGYNDSVESFEFKNHEIDLLPGQSFYMTTDGYLDQNGPDDPLPLGPVRFAGLIEKAPADVFEEQEAYFRSILEYPIKKHEQIDDITVVGFKVL